MSRAIAHYLAGDPPDAIPDLYEAMRFDLDPPPGLGYRARALAAVGKGTKGPTECRDGHSARPR